jgi:hypothetical protein
MRWQGWLIGIAVMSMMTGAEAQTAGAYESGGTEEKSGLLDPSRLSMSHSLSFGMMGAKGYSLQSQSLAATMLQYKISEPLTLNLDFGFPIHSTFREEANLSRSNMESMDYFRNMPLGASLTWQPNPRFMMRLSVHNNTAAATRPFPGYMMPAPGLLGDW